VAHAVKPRGHVIVSTFGPEGPSKCSGLDVVRYEAESLHGVYDPRSQIPVWRGSERREPPHASPELANASLVFRRCHLLPRSDQLRAIPRAIAMEETRALAAVDSAGG
jgi:hypothetical protein